MPEENKKSEEQTKREKPVIPKDLWCEAMNEYLYKQGVYSFEKYIAIQNTIPKYFRKEIEERKRAEAERRKQEREAQKNATEE